MTPAIEALESCGCRFTLHLYSSKADGDFGFNAAEKLALAPEQVFKSLVVDIDERHPVIALVPVSKKLSLKLIAKAAGARKAKMAEPKDAENATGYVIGGICPIGLKRELRIFADSSIERFANVFISGGKRGVELEIGSKDLQKITNAVVAHIVD